ncbi:MAG TPA: nuclease-related domain-containing protein [Pseudoneobacillus sp.]|nr:nuclease-related domain-containing protein [Pseudoneobacillus sp.]
MILKPRFESLEIRILRSLNYRMKLSEKIKNHYDNLEKGFIGEQLFDVWKKNYINGGLILNDLLFESNNTIFQIDSLLIAQGKIFQFEVKNYEGDYYLEGEKWYTICKTEINSPVIQLKRSESLLGRLLQDLGFNPSINAYVIFVNPEFHLYNAPMNIPIIYPSQIKRFLNNLNIMFSTTKDEDFKIAEKLLSVHLNKSPYTLLPDYCFEQLKKGILCPTCHSFMEIFQDNTLKCCRCNSEEDVTTAVLRSVEEFVLLFPDKKITTNAIHEWCKVIESKKTIRRILMKKYKPMGYGKHYYFIINENNNSLI